MFYLKYTKDIGHVIAYTLVLNASILYKYHSEIELYIFMTKLQTFKCLVSRLTVSHEK